MMKSEAQEIAESVATWLHYKSLTGLNGLLNESSMAVPIAEYLSAKHGREVHSEKAHPLFSNNLKGRPKQLDFVRLKNNDDTWHAAYESKFDTVSFDLIVNDLCRLLCLAQASNVGSPRRYFIYGAQTEGEKGIFLANKFNSGDGLRKSYFEAILPRKMAVKNLTFRLKELHEKQLKVFRAFAKDHDVGLPSKIRVELGGLLKSGNYVCAVWQLWASQGSSLIKHGEMVP
jgi:hypothetical protein